MTSSALTWGPGNATDLSLAPENRRAVLWLGGPVPMGLEVACAQRQLRLVPIGRGELNPSAPTACALVLEFQDEECLAPDPDAVISVALDHGLVIIVVHGPATEPQTYYASAAPLVAKAPDRVSALYRNWDEIAQRISVYHPGPGASTSTRLLGDVPSDREAVMLLGRAFSDLQSVTLEIIQGGRSGADVWIATPGPSDVRRQPRPCLVKIQRIAKAREEKQKFEEHVLHKVPYWQHPQFHAKRYVEGSTCALLVQDFMEHARPLREMFTRAVPGQVCGSLFGSALRGWLAGATAVTGSLVQPFTDLKALHWSASLSDAADVARRRTTRVVPPPEKLQARLAALPSVQYRQATIHGDLHVDNLFLAAGSCDVQLIDFASVMIGPLVADPACLEVSIVFPSRDFSAGNGAAGDLQLPPEQWLRAAYVYPLNPADVAALPRQNLWRSDAVREIRSGARQHEPSPVPYAIAVVSYLIRYASYDDHASVEDRALAYELACEIVEAVQCELANVNRCGTPTPHSESHDAN